MQPTKKNDVFANRNVSYNHILAYTDVHSDLVQQCLHGDRVAQSKLYRSFARAMYNVCVRMTGSVPDAEDVLQNAFVDVFGKLHQFRRESSVGAWIKRIVVNHCIDFVRHRRPIFDALDESHHNYTTESDEEATNERALTESVAAVCQAIQLLPDGYRMVLSLYLLEGYDHEEIGQILGVSEQTSKSQYHRGRLRLRELLLKKNIS